MAITAKGKTNPQKKHWLLATLIPTPQSINPAKLVSNTWAFPVVPFCKADDVISISSLVFWQEIVGSINNYV